MTLRLPVLHLVAFVIALGCVAEPASPIVNVIVVQPDDGGTGGTGQGGSGGQGGASATASTTSTTGTTSSTSGQGGTGEGGTTGEGGSGGAPCEPSAVDCAALPPGQCGDVSDDCGGTVMCGTLSGACDAGLWCNLDANACGCPSFAPSDAPPTCDAFPGYEPRKCGDVASEDTPAECFQAGVTIFLEVVWCCPAG